MNQHESDMELAFAHARSKDKICGICMEVVMVSYCDLLHSKTFRQFEFNVKSEKMCLKISFFTF